MSVAAPSAGKLRRSASHYHFFFLFSCFFSGGRGGIANDITSHPDNKINLKGLAVGNGCWGSKVGLCAFGADMDRINTCVSSISPSESTSSSDGMLGYACMSQNERLC